jgi:rubredoxin
LPIVAQAGTPALFRIAALVHEATVIALLAVLPYGKLGHVFIRPLHLGAQLVRAASPRDACCPRCGVTMAPAAQVDAVESLLAARGFTFSGYQRLCPLCRRRQLASVHAQLLGARFQPRPVASVGHRAALPEAA